MVRPVQGTELHKFGSHSKVVESEEKHICVRDIVLVHYTSKSFPGTYRLTRVKQVEVDEVDGLIHTSTVVYSLLAELKPKDRADNKGITKKELRVPAQRLVLILPIEELEVQKDTVLNEETEAETTSEPDVEEADVASVHEVADCTGYSWGGVGSKFGGAWGNQLRSSDEEGLQTV